MTQVLVFNEITLSPVTYQNSPALWDILILGRLPTCMSAMLMSSRQT